MKFNLKNYFVGVLAGALLIFNALSIAQTPLSPDSYQKNLRLIYKELVEINTTDSVGSCTKAASAMAQHLKKAGFDKANLQLIVPPGGPQKGNLVATIKGKNENLKPILLLAHIDVVEAKRQDWERDPFKLIEENGNFYARGAADDKSMAAIYVANLIRMKNEKYIPERSIVMALTCDEEKIPTEFNGVEYLLKNHRQLIDAELAINEGADNLFRLDGSKAFVALMASEKVFQTYSFETTNPGGHSARPRKDNAIYELARGLVHLGDYSFPVKLNEVTKAYLEKMSSFESGQLAEDMKAIASNPNDQAALARMSEKPYYNNLLRTTCVATMLTAGHATNALPQRAKATVNCRILPGESVDEVQKTLQKVVANDKIKITPDHVPVLSPPSPLTEKIVSSVTKVSNQIFPGIPVIPTMLVATTDGRFLNNAGIPTYGVNGIFRDSNGGYIHGLNERMPVSSLFEGQEFLYRLTVLLSGS
jgi:acetylornithine deacetylase/succinyl-diaminopimelate desuccinylase-like protein